MDAVPHRRPDQRAGQLGRRGRPVHPRPAGGNDHRHVAPPRPGPRRGHRRADVVVTSYTLFRLDADAYCGGAVVRADPRRSPVRQEPPVQGVPVRPAASGAVQAGHHRDPDGEQPDGAVVDAVDHRTGPVPEPDAVPRALRPADREEGGRRAAGPLAAPDQAAGQAPDQGAGGADLPAKQEQVLDVELDTKHRRIYQRHLQRERQKVLGLLDDVDRNRFTILRSLTLLRQLSLHPALIDARALEAELREDRHPAGAARRGDRRGAPGPGVQPVHRLPRTGTGAARCGRSGRTPTSTARTRNRATVVDEFKRWLRPGLPDQPEGRWIRAQPHRSRLLLPARPVVEPCGRGPGGRPHPPDRADPQRSWCTA